MTVYLEYADSLTTHYSRVYFCVDGLICVRLLIRLIIVQIINISVILILPFDNSNNCLMIMYYCKILTSTQNLTAFVDAIKNVNKVCNLC